MPDTEEVYASDRAAWRAWLAANATRPQGIWLIYARGGELTYGAIVEEALCFGWVDSKTGRHSDTQATLYLSPRRPTSGWSRSNKERVARLTAAGLMQPPGLAAIETAKANGAWTSLDRIEALEVPADLGEALDARPGARAAWEGFSRSAKREYLQWIAEAKRAQTRAARVTRTADEAAQGGRVKGRPETTE